MIMIMCYVDKMEIWRASRLAKIGYYQQ